MARIRTIKPEFFRHERLAELPALTRLLFVGLWTLADRFGRLEDRPKRIKVELLPYDAGDVDKMLARLADAGFIVRYGVGAGRYIAIPSFEEHQRINGKEAAAPETIPPPPTGTPVQHSGSNGDAPETHQGSTGEAPVQLSGSNGDHRKGREGKGREGSGGTEGADAPPPPPPAHTVTPLRTPNPFMARDAWLSLAESWNQATAKVPAWSAVTTATLPSQSQATLLKALRECPDLAAWDARFARAATSAWLTGQQPGRDGTPFVADLWWLLGHISELDAGRYDTREKVPFRSAEQAEQDAIWARFEARAKAAAE